MKKLTRKEEEIMNHFWDKGAMFVRELLELYPEPKPHFNTLSTMVRTLEANGYLSHKAYGSTYQYYPVVSREEYAGSSFRGIVRSYFNNSYLNAVSALVKEEKISIEELKDLIEQIEKGQYSSLYDRISDISGQDSSHTGGILYVLPSPAEQGYIPSFQ